MYRHAQREGEREGGRDKDVKVSRFFEPIQKDTQTILTFHVTTALAFD